MTDTSNVDNQTLEGAGGNQPPVSPGNGDSIVGAPQSSQELLNLNKTVARLESELKGLQSRQDKSQSETQRFMEDVKAHVAKGLSLDEAEQAVTQSRKAEAKDDLLYRIAQKVGVLDGSSQNVTGNNGNATDEAAQVFDKYGVGNDPVALSRFASLKGAELKAAVADYAFEKTKQPPPDSSTAGSLQGKPPVPVGEDGLIKQYQKDMTAAQGNPSLARSIKAEAIKKGVPVDSVVFH